jgi:hypothetical protein
VKVSFHKSDWKDRAEISVRTFQKPFFASIFLLVRSVLSMEESTSSNIKPLSKMIAQAF